MRWETRECEDAQGHERRRVAVFTIETILSEKPQLLGLTTYQFELVYVLQVFVTDVRA